MNKQDFNKKYSSYIEEGFIGLEFENNRVTRFLDDVFTDLIKIPNFKFSQIKLKFNQARFYSSLEGRIQYLIENEINELIKIKDE